MHPEFFNVYPQPDKLIGAAVQQRVFRDPALLPVYGSSELTQPRWNRADEFFGQHPTGFGAFLIGNPGETNLMIASKLAAVGMEAQGKKVVIFLSPGSFVSPELDHRGFGVNFSALHAGIFAFESHLSTSLKQALARRLLDYPETIGQSALLDRALHDLAANTPVARADLALLAPLAALHNWTLRQSDYGKLANWSWLQDQLPLTMNAVEPPSPRSGPIHWEQRIDQVEAIFGQQRLPTSYSTGPRTGFDDNLRAFFRDKQHPERSADDVFARACEASKEWVDFQLVLRIAQESGLHLLLVCQPLNAGFTRLQGLTANSTDLFYNRLRQAVAPFPLQLATFPSAEPDPHFYHDCIHPSAKAWIVYDQRLDRFFHAPAL